jgi:hypothetical protein
MSANRYDPRIINALDRTLERHYPAYRSNVLRDVARELGIEPEPMESEIDITQIDWKTGEGQPATVEDEWAWAFAYTREAELKPEARELVEAIRRRGSVMADGFEVKLGGRDRRLLNRKRINA